MIQLEVSFKKSNKTFTYTFNDDKIGKEFQARWKKAGHKVKIVK